MMGKRWALIIDGFVYELTDIDPAGRFAPELKWVECDPSVKEGFIYSRGKFTEPKIP